VAGNTVRFSYGTLVPVKVRLVTNCYKLKFHGSSFLEPSSLQMPRGCRAGRRGCHKDAPGDATRKLLPLNLRYWRSVTFRIYFAQYNTYSTNSLISTRDELDRKALIEHQ